MLVFCAAVYHIDSEMIEKVVLCARQRNNRTSHLMRLYLLHPAQVLDVALDAAVESAVHPRLHSTGSLDHGFCHILLRGIVHQMLDAKVR